eukprot:GGOE01004756.1.p1 GENE.GGOE01004756.1~~GGOE01004756.1.p1  ORF type:complete len:434 (-),score=104.32 GGOE01004756.1:402-1703(-)
MASTVEGSHQLYAYGYPFESGPHDSTVHRTASDSEVMDIYLPAGVEMKKHSRPKAKLKYIGNQRVLGATPEMEKELRTKVHADLAAQANRRPLMPEEPPIPKMQPPRRGEDSPGWSAKNRSLTPEAESRRHTKLLGLPMSYSEPLFAPSSPKAVEPASCFSPKSLAETAPTVILPALDSSVRTAFVSSMNLRDDSECLEEGPSGGAPPMLDLLCGTDDAVGHMALLREDRQRVRHQRLQQQDRQLRDMLEQYRRMEDDAKEREARRARVKTMESAQLWLLYKMAEQGSEDANHAWRQARGLLRDRSPPPHAALLTREEAEAEKESGASSPAKPFQCNVGIVCYRSPPLSLRRSKSPPAHSVRLPDHFVVPQTSQEAQAGKAPSPSEEGRRETPIEVEPSTEATDPAQPVASTALLALDRADSPAADAVGGATS